MNIVGEIGNFIIKYQEPIQIAAIFIAIIAVAWIIIKIWKNGRKKHEILSQINDTVSEINTAVNHLNDKKAEVIYIDSRMSPGAAEAGIKEIVNVKAEETTGVDAEGKEDQEPAVEDQEAPAEPEEEKIEPSLKYFSRDCAISKTGKQFTLEELNAQIRE